MTTCMLAHSITTGVPIGLGPQRLCGIVPLADDWVRLLYQWQEDYMQKLRKDLIMVGMWDRARLPPLRVWCHLMCRVLVGGEQFGAAESIQSS